jgi:PilZ domain
MPALKEGTSPLMTRSPRVCKTLPVTLWEASAESAKRWSGAILDLSDHGLRVATASALYPGQVISVLLTETGLCFKRCRVVWTRPFRVPPLSQAGLEVLK